MYHSQEISTKKKPFPEQKPTPARSGNRVWRTYFIQLAACLVISILLGSIIIVIDGENPINVYVTLVKQAFFTQNGLMIAVQRATPYLLTSAAAVMAFEGGAINMGLEGQFAVGAAIASVAGGALPEMPKVIAIPIILVLCGIGGAAAGFIPALFRRMSGVSEVITGMIANMIISPLLSLLFMVPFLRAARATAFENGVQPWAQLTQFSELTHGGWGFGTKANTGIFVALLIVILLAIVLKRTRLGYEIRITKSNFSFSEFAGIHAGRCFFIALMLSGAIAAMAGATETLGTWRANAAGDMNVGNKGLVLALAGGNSFFGSAIAALIYGGLESGAMNVSWATNIARPLIDILVELTVIMAAMPSMRLFFSGSSFSDVERLGGQFRAGQT